MPHGQCGTCGAMRACSSAFCGYHSTAYANPPPLFAVSTPTPARKNTASSNSSQDNGEAGGAALIGAGLIMAGIAVAASAVVYGTYKVTEFCINSRYGKREENKLYAGLATAGIFITGALGFYAEHVYQEHMIKKYPALSVYMDEFRNFTAARGLTISAAESTANSECKPHWYSSCEKVATISAGAPGCISVAKNIHTENTYFRNVIGPDGKDKLTESKLFHTFASVMAGAEKEMSGIGDIEYYCNTPEMNDKILALKESSESSSAAAKQLEKDAKEIKKPTPSAVIKPAVSIKVDVENPEKIIPIKDKDSQVFYRINATYLNIRTSGKGSAIVAKARQNSCVSVAPNSKPLDDFIKVTAKDPSLGTFSGYVSMKYLVRDPSNISDCTAKLHLG